MPDWKLISPSELRQLGLVRLSLEIASELPSSVPWQAAECWHRFGQLVEVTAAETERHLRTSRNHPDQQDLTDAEFRMLSLVTTLRRKLGIHYNQRFMQGAYDGRDSCHLFLHGILCGRGGTCASLPLLYVAIGRALGYPLYVSQARGHALCRWDDGCGERFNVEATTYGYNQRDDDHYLRGPRPIAPEEVARGAYLQNLTPHQEVALLLAERGVCWLEHLQLAKSLEALSAASWLHAVHGPYRTLRGVAQVLLRVYGDPHGDWHQLDIRALEDRPDLVRDFGEALVDAAQKDLERITTNWSSRPPSPDPDFSVPDPTAVPAHS